MKSPDTPVRIPVDASAHTPAHALTANIASATTSVASTTARIARTPRTAVFPSATQKGLEMERSTPGTQFKDLSENDSRRKTVLLVDDEPLVRNVELHMLNAAGYDVISAGSGEEGISLYRSRQNDIDLVILDYTMPGINGRETWERLRQVNPDVTVVFCSGNCPQKESTALIAEGARGYIPKPFLISDFVPRIQQILGD